MRKNMMNSSMKSILLAGILIATVATTACAGVKAQGVTPKTTEAETSGPSVPTADMNQEAAKPEAGMEFDDAYTNTDANQAAGMALDGAYTSGANQEAGMALDGAYTSGANQEDGMALNDAYTNTNASDLQINYYDTEEAGGIMTLEAANHWARFDFFSNPTIGEDWSYTMDNNILDVEKTYTAKDPSDTMNINDGTTRFVLTPNALGTVTITFNYGKAGAEPDDTMISTFVVDEDLRITLVKAENPHGDKSMIVRPVVK